MNNLEEFDLPSDKSGIQLLDLFTDLTKERMDEMCKELFVDYWM